jgi:hypothetical protein
MCKHEKTALVRGWYASGRKWFKLGFQRLFDCCSIISEESLSKNRLFTFIHIAE